MRVKSPEEMAKALENCVNNGPCNACPYDAPGSSLYDCTNNICRDAAETIRLLLLDLAMETETEA